MLRRKGLSGRAEDLVLPRCGRGVGRGNPRLGLAYLVHSMTRMAWLPAGDRRGSATLKQLVVDTDERDLRAVGERDDIGRARQRF
jgi:hypothetical protein